MKPLSIAATFVALSITTAFAQTTPSTSPANPLRRPAPATSAPASSAQPATTEPAPAKPARRRARPAKSKTSGDFAERRKRCSGEWREAKASNNTGGRKWPQFFSACNTRLKAAGV